MVQQRIVKLSEEQKELREIICKGKAELIKSKCYFDVGVEGTVLRARVSGAGDTAVKFSFNIGGISKTKKSVRSDFFLGYDELDDNLIIQIKTFLGDVEEEEVAEENITVFTASAPAK